MRIRHTHRIVSMALVLAMLLGFIPAGERASAANKVEYRFTLGAYVGESETNAEEYRAFPEEGSGSARQWAYIGTSAVYSNSLGLFVDLGKGYMSIPLNGRSSGEWAAFRMRVAEAGNYKISLNAYAYQNAGNLGMYIVPAQGEILDILAPDNADTYGTISLKEGTKATYVRSGARYDLPVFADGKNKVGEQNFWAEKGSADVGMRNAEFGSYTFDAAGEYILLLRAESIGAALIHTLTMEKSSDAPATEKSGAKAEYLFKKGAYAGETTADAAAYPEYPAEGSASARQWAYIGTTADLSDSKGNFTDMGNWIATSFTQAGGWVAMKIKVPAAGSYGVSVSGYCYPNAGVLDLYIIPSSEALLTALADPAIYGTIAPRSEGSSILVRTGADNELKALNVFDEKYKVGSGDFSGSKKAVIELPYGNWNFDAAGEYVAFFRAGASSAGKYNLLFSALTLNGLKFDHASLRIEPGEIYLGETAQATVKAYCADDSEIDLNALAAEDHIVYSSSNKDVAEVNAVGKITAKSAGESLISAAVYIDGVERVVEQRLVVKEKITLARAELRIAQKLAVGASAQASVVGYGTQDEVVNIPAKQVELSVVAQSPDGAVTVAAGGLVTAHAVGTATLRAKVQYDGQELDTQEVTVTIGEKIAAKSGMKLDFSVNAYGETEQNMENLTKYGAERPWAFVGHTISSADYPYPARQGGYFQAVMQKPGEYLALRFQVAEAGEYQVSMDALCRARSAIAGIYMFPYSDAAAKDIPVYLNTANKIGEADTYAPQNEFKHFEIGKFYATEPGEYMLVFNVEGHNPSSWEYTLYAQFVTLTGTNALGSVEASLAGQPLSIGATGQIELALKDMSGAPINPEEDGIFYDYASSAPQIVKVDSFGNVTGVSEGSCDVTVSVTRYGVTQTATLPVTVEDRSDLLSVVIKNPGELWTRGTRQLTAYAQMSSGNEIPIPEEFVTYRVVSMSPEHAATLTEKGEVTGVAVGSVTVVVEAKFKGKVLQSEPLEIQVVYSSAVEPAVTTLEQREIMRENIAKYPWATAETDAVIKAADRYVDRYDEIWNLVVAEGLPRYYHVGYKYDPDKFKCRYCGCDLSAKYHPYGWLVDALNEPYKIQCPDCRRKFPSNDFGGFYQLGLDAHGIFNYEQAKAKNDELVAAGEDGYLKNLLYPEKNTAEEPNWGVDDGFGYFTGRTYSNGVAEKHTYIAYYLHEGLWSNQANSVRVPYGGLLAQSLEKLAKAYNYTGDIRYGRAGAIILDRVADVYKDLDWKQWGAFRGDSYDGKALDIVWNCTLATNLAYAYDAFLPAYSDAQTIDYLKAKAEKYQMKNPKDSPMAVRRNVEDNILRETFANAVSGKISGNFGMTQETVATAALALNTAPETNEWLD